MKLVWATDIHMNFLESADRKRFQRSYHSPLLAMLNQLESCRKLACNIIKLMILTTQS